MISDKSDFGHCCRNVPLRETAPQTPRPRWLTALVMALLLFQIGVVIHAMRVPGEVAGAMSLPSWAQGIAGVIWGLIFAQAAISLLRRRPGAVKRAFLWVTGFIAYSALRLAIFARSDYDRGRLSFWVVMLTTGGCVYGMCRWVRYIRKGRIT